MKALKILLLIDAIVALGLDALSLLTMLGHAADPSIHRLPGMGLHAVALVLGVVAFIGLAPASYRANWKPPLALFVSFAVPLPVVGMVLPFAFLAMHKLRSTVGLQKDFVLGERKVLTQLKVDEAGMTSRRSVLEILSGKDGDSRRKAVIALRAVDPKRSIPVLQRAVQDSDEQVRLLAQTQFTRIIASLELSIKKLEAGLTQPPRDASKLLRLAEHYYELVYLGLSTAETDTIYLGRASELLTEALQLEPGNQKCRFMLLKCQTKRHLYNDARETITALRAANFKDSFLLPWEAEIFYDLRNWTAFTRTLEKMDADPRTDSRLLGTVRFWLDPPSVHPLGT